jgi:hypothetical protein
MTCDEAQALLDAGDVRPELAAHLADCAGCGGTAAVLACCAELPEEPIPEGFEAELRRRLASAPRPRPAPPRWALWSGGGLAAVAAAVVLVVGVRTAVAPNRAPSAASGSSAVTQEQAGTARGLFGAPAAGPATTLPAQPSAGAAGAVRSAGPQIAAPFAPAIHGPAQASSAGSAASGSAAVPAPVPSLGGGVLGRDLVQQASVTLKVDHVAQAFTQVSEAAAALGGFVAQSDFSSGNGASRATATVRVPVGVLQTFLDRIALMGTVTAQSRSSQDVTQQVVDVSARLEALRAEEAAYQRLYAKASSVADMIQVQQQLTQVQSQIDTLQAEQQALSRMVDLATVSLTLVPAHGGSPLDRGQGGGVLQGAWAAMLAALRVLLLALGWLLPWAVAAGLGWLAVRLVRAARGRL